MPAVIDHLLFPQIVDRVVYYAPFDELMVLRSVSRGMRRRAERWMVEHVAFGADDLPGDESSSDGASEDSGSRASTEDRGSRDSNKRSPSVDSLVREVQELHGYHGGDLTRESLYRSPRDSDEESSSGDSFDDGASRDSDKKSWWGDSDEESWRPHDPRCALREPAPPFRRLPMTYRGLLCKRMRALLRHVRCIDYYGIQDDVLQSEIRFFLPPTVVVRYMHPVKSVWLDFRANTVVTYHDYRWNVNENRRALENRRAGSNDYLYLDAHGGSRVIHYLRVCADDARCFEPVHWRYPWDRCMRSAVLVLELYDRQKPAPPRQRRRHRSCRHNVDDERWGFLCAVPRSAALMLLRGVAVTLVGMEAVPPELVSLGDNVIDELRTAIMVKVQHYKEDSNRFGGRRSVGRDVDRAMALLSFETLDNWRASPTSDWRETEKPPIAEQWVGWHPNDLGIYADYGLDVNNIDVYERAPFQPYKGEPYAQLVPDDESLPGEGTESDASVDSDSTESACSLEIPDPDYSRTLGKKRKDWEDDGVDSDWSYHFGLPNFSGTDSDTST